MDDLGLRKSSNQTPLYLRVGNAELKTEALYLTCVFKIPEECRTLLIGDPGEGVIWVHSCEVDNKGSEGVRGGHDLIHLVRQGEPPSNSLKQDCCS